MKNMFLKIYSLMVLLISSVSLYGSNVVAEIEYFYSDDGTIIGKAFNGKRVNFEYDLRGQLLAVKDASGNDLERYTYDPAGNRLSKTINGVTTTYSYDEANQLIRSTVNGEITYYEYDAAGRMIQVGDKSYIYNGNNKVIEVRQNGETIAKFEYNIDGQIAKAIYGDKKEEFIWDGLALIWRSGVTYINEPYVTGGNPVMAGDDVLFNDMLGSTLAVNDKAVEMTSFGETDNENVFFTGKPMIDELGYSFLFRDYNPNQGKWTTSDPLGYPDGWNNLAYCGNSSLIFVDFLGAFMVGYFDLNSGATPSLVISADDMIIGNKLIGGGNAEDVNGEFFCGIKSVSRDFGGVLIKLVVAINVIAQKHDAQFQTGEKSKFHEHESTPNDSYMVNSVYEAIVAHERGHAEAFFHQWRTLFSATLRRYNIDNPSLTISEVKQIVLRAYEETWNIHIAYSGFLANEKTNAWFEGNPTWKEMPSETAKNGDTLYVWKKVE